MANLIRWEPFRDMVSLREAMDRLFEDSLVRPGVGWPARAGAEVLAVDVYETDDAVVVKTAVPGISPEDLDVSVTGDVLTIRGETKAEEEIKEGNYIRRERRYGRFSRSVTLPGHLETDKTEAEFKDGVLTLTVPKSEEVKRKAIEVKIK